MPEEAADNVYLFPIRKEILTKSDSEIYAHQIGEKGVSLTYCKCGCDAVVVVPFGAVTSKDLLWAAEQLREYALMEMEDEEDV